MNCIKLIIFKKITNNKSNMKNSRCVFVLLTVGFSLLLWASIVLRDPLTNGFCSWNSLQKAGNVDGVGNDEVLDNLLPIGFDEKSCLSRFESSQYRRRTQRKASPYLISKLRSYEARHKKCGTHTESYNKTVQLLKTGGIYNSSTDVDCRYIVWISFEGLGNKMLTLASAFLYALLTDRVVLADRGVDIPDLFCEPFPDASWFLPLDFPLSGQFRSFDQKSNRSYGNLVVKSNSSLEPYIYLHLVHDYDDQDKLFFCDEDQAYLGKIPWLIMKSDVYFIPSLFLMPAFREELHELFPEKQTVFHHLSRYLFHPTNSVWGLITRYYEAYLSKADEIVGIQIRVLETEPGPFKHIFDQILSCTMREKILPQIEHHDRGPINSSEREKTVAVLMTSLSSGYSEQLRDLYLENPMATGEVVGVFQPSHEMYQQSDKHDHNRKAWAEIYLLSLTDKLLTSGWSTFGYVAQALGGLKPWIMYRPENRTAPDPPCGRAVSMEPCFMSPPYYDCRMRRGVDVGDVVPHVRHCEDVSWGIKLV